VEVTSNPEPSTTDILFCLATDQENPAVSPIENYVNPPQIAASILPVTTLTRTSISTTSTTSRSDTGRCSTKTVDCFAPAPADISSFSLRQIPPIITKSGKYDVTIHHTDDSSDESEDETGGKQPKRTLALLIREKHIPRITNRLDNVETSHVRSGERLDWLTESVQGLFSKTNEIQESGEEVDSRLTRHQTHLDSLYNHNVQQYQQLSDHSTQLVELRDERHASSSQYQTYINNLQEATAAAFQARDATILKLSGLVQEHHNSTQNQISDLAKIRAGDHCDSSVGHHHTYPPVELQQFFRARVEAVLPDLLVRPPILAGITSHMTSTFVTVSMHQGLVNECKRTMDQQAQANAGFVSNNKFKRITEIQAQVNATLVSHDNLK